jgi:hypothetical protein
MKYLKLKYKHIVDQFPVFPLSECAGNQHLNLVRCGDLVYKVPAHIYDQIEYFNGR